MSHDVLKELELLEREYEVMRYKLLDAKDEIAELKKQLACLKKK